MSDSQKALEDNSLDVDLQLAEISARAKLLSEILRACEPGGELEHRTDLQTVFATGLALMADDISRAAMAAYDGADALSRWLGRPAMEPKG
jgi:hypothetical protein